MQHKNSFLRLKLFAVLCVLLLGQGLFIGSAQAYFAGDADRKMSAVSWGHGRLDVFVVGADKAIWLKSFENQWHPWTSLGKPGGDTVQSVSAVAWGINRLDVFGVTGEINASVYRVWHKAWDGWNWSNWENLGTGGANLVAGVHAVSWGPGHLEIFTRSTNEGGGNGPVVHKWWQGGWGPSQTGWDTLYPAGTVATFRAHSHVYGQMNIFGTGESTRDVVRRFFDGSSWKPTVFGAQAWQQLHGGGLSINTPYAVSLDANRMDVFVRGNDGAIWRSGTLNGGSSWSGWSSIGQPGSNFWFASPSAIALKSNNRLAVFGIAPNRRVYHKAWDGASWWPSQTGWEHIGGNWTGDVIYPPQPVSWGDTRIDLFMLHGGTVYHKWTDGAGWGPTQTDWENLGQP